MSEVIVKTLLDAVHEANKDKVLVMLLCEYLKNDTERVNHIMKILCDSSYIVTLKDVDTDYIKDNIYNYAYLSEDEYDVKDITITDVDNISCAIKVEYSYKKKDDETWHNTYSTINFTYNPKVLR